MSDKLEWRKRHAVLLREPQWAGIAARENYKIRADLRPLFEAHPHSEELLFALEEQKLWREGCEFIARMTHRRAAVWWGYCCLLTLFEERKAVAEGRIVKKPDVPGLDKVKELAAQAGIKLGDPTGSLDDLDTFCKMPEFDIRKMLEDPPVPPQDETALDAAVAAVKGKADAIDALLPPEIAPVFAASKAKIDETYRTAFGKTADELLAEACTAAKAQPLTYTVDRTSDPSRQALLALPDQLEAMRQGVVNQLKGLFPEKYPKTPEAAKLLKAEADKISDDAVQAVWRWIVAPDERNTTLALAAGNAAAQLPEGLLAYTAAWSFGDLTPEGKQMIPVPPELPGTGLVSTLLMLALDQGGYRKAAERYELYFNLGLEVVYGKNLWPESVMEELSPHQQLAVESAATTSGATAGDDGSVYRKWTK